MNRHLLGEETGNCIYVGYDMSGFFKIGMTENYQKRAQQIQNMNPKFEILCAYSQDKPAVSEAALHAHFANKRVVGEWFELSVEDLQYIVYNYSSYRPDYEDIFNAWKSAGGRA